MRDILFRGKTENGKWVYGSLIKTGDFCCILQDDDGTNYDYPYLDKPTGCIDGYATLVDPETVGQYSPQAAKKHSSMVSLLSKLTAAAAPLLMVYSTSAMTPRKARDLPKAQSPAAIPIL